jgi:uncharacterized membrane protein YdbT with pleckstrin-like domain
MAQTKWENVTLQPNETIIMTLSPSYRMPGLAWGLLALVTLPTVIGPLVVVAVAALPYWMSKQNRYAVTNQRLLARVGAFNKRMINVPLARVTDVEVQRPFMCAFIGNGAVLVNTSGGAGKEFQLGGLHNPDEFHDKIQALLHPAS